MQKYTNNVTDNHGNSLGGATVTVYDATGALASLYSDDGVTQQANPFAADNDGIYSFYAADGVYSVTVSKANFGSKTITGVLLDDALSYRLKAWAYSQAFAVTSATRNSDGAITTASIVWPDGTTGTYTADTLSTAFPGATDAWHATYNSTPAKTVTQAAVTRDPSTGAVTAQPAITIA